MEVNKKPSKAETALLKKIQSVSRGVPAKKSIKPNRKIAQKPLPKVSAVLVKKIKSIKADKTLLDGIKVKNISELKRENMSSIDTNYIDKQATALYNQQKKKLLKSSK